MEPTKPRHKSVDTIEPIRLTAQYLARLARCSGVAQQVEQVAVNHRVGGSSPSAGASEKGRSLAALFRLGLRDLRRGNGSRDVPPGTRWLAVPGFPQNEIASTLRLGDSAQAAALYIRPRYDTKMASRRQILVLGALGVGWAARLRAQTQGEASDPSMRRHALYLQPLGQALPEEDVAIVVTALRQIYGLDVRGLPRAELPSSAYFAPGKRYRAEKLLDFLAPRLPGDGVRILGLTAADISTTKGKVYDWGILGLGSLDGAAGVLSAFRCHKRSRGPQHARERLAKVAVHEIGHTLGLEHCTQRGCLMEDAEGSVLTTDREYDLCARCREQLGKAGYRLPTAPNLPWPRPPSTRPA